MPGESTRRMILIAACIGVMSGVATIVFREAVDLVHEVIFVWGYEAAGDRRRRLADAAAAASADDRRRPAHSPFPGFPGLVNGYGFTNFLRRVNLENGVIRARNIFIKIISTALTIGSGNSAGSRGRSPRSAGRSGPGRPAFPGLGQTDESLYCRRLRRRHCRHLQRPHGRHVLCR
jgi:chloride channel protein, CIC family